MRTRLGRLLPQALTLVAGTLTAVVLASATLSARVITLTVPNYSVTSPLFHCEPQNDATANRITLSGVPAGSNVTLTWLIRSGLPGGALTMVTQSFTNQDGTLTYTIPYPEETSAWPGQDGTNRFIVVSVVVAVTNSTGTTKLGGGPWKVICTPVPKGGTEGCTPGFWRQVGDPFAHSDQHLDAWLPTRTGPPTISRRCSTSMRASARTGWATRCGWAAAAKMRWPGMPWPLC